MLFVNQLWRFARCTSSSAADCTVLNSKEKHCVTILSWATCDIHIGPKHEYIHGSKYKM